MIKVELYVFVFSFRAKSPQPPLEGGEAEEEDEEKVRLDPCEFSYFRSGSVVSYILIVLSA